ncbi:hypothetical protein C6575_24555 [Nocardia seriolae]|nr:hypothetical protein C6575_24555 [Nocardia seriolae]
MEAQVTHPAPAPGSPDHRGRAPHTIEREPYIFAPHRHCGRNRPRVEPNQDHRLEGDRLVTHKGVDWLAPIEASTRRFVTTVESLTDADLSGASLIPPWTRGHVITHVCRATDSLIRLLTWARTGIETPQYASMEARAAEIEAGAPRPVAIQLADLLETADRFADAVRALPPRGLGPHGPPPHRRTPHPRNPHPHGPARAGNPPHRPECRLHLHRHPARRGPLDPRRYRRRLLPPHPRIPIPPPPRHRHRLPTRPSTATTLVFR